MVILRGHMEPHPKCGLGVHVMMPDRYQEHMQSRMHNWGLEESMEGLSGSCEMA